MAGRTHAQCVACTVAHCAVCAQPWPCRDILTARVADLEIRLERALAELADVEGRAIVAEQERDDLAAVAADARVFVPAAATCDQIGGSHGAT